MICILLGLAALVVGYSILALLGALFNRLFMGQWPVDFEDWSTCAMLGLFAAVVLPAFFFVVYCLGCWLRSWL